MQAGAQEEKLRPRPLSVLARVCVLFSFVFFTMPVTTPAFAESVVVQKSAKGGIRSAFKPRWGKGHKGVDYTDPCGTNISTAGPLTCTIQGGYGAIGFVKRGCGVEEAYAHLSQCRGGSTSLVTGGAKGAVGSGNSQGCHLHYEIRLSGCQVDPEVAYGKDLCQESVKKELLADAKQKLGRFATCSGGAATPQDTNGGGGSGGGGNGGGNSGGGNSGGGNSGQDGYKSITQVDPGQVDPNTGKINDTGGSYYSAETHDGKIIRHVDMGMEENDTPVMEDSQNDNFTQPSQTSNEVTGCATDTWKAMVNQSVLQTRREMMINERYVAKADSVMAYSCLSDQFLKVGENLGPVFSESKKWANRQIDIQGKTVTVNIDFGDTSLDGAINTGAEKAYENFLQSFQHGFLGGIGGGTGGGSGEEEGAAAQAYTPCGMMAQVWNLAKCTNLTDNPPFPKFDELIERSSDPRKYPKNMQCMNTGITQNMIDTAKGKEVKFDKVKLYYDKLLPLGGKCAAAIKTGVTVTVRQGQDRVAKETSYADGVCITAGCSYQNNGGDGDGECKVK